MISFIFHSIFRVNIALFEIFHGNTLRKTYKTELEGVLYHSNFHPNQFDKMSHQSKVIFSFLNKLGGAIETRSNINTATSIRLFLRHEV